MVKSPNQCSITCLKRKLPWKTLCKKSDRFGLRPKIESVKAKKTKSTTFKTKMTILMKNLAMNERFLLFYKFTFHPLTLQRIICEFVDTNISSIFAVSFAAFSLQIR